MLDSYTVWEVIYHLRIDWDKLKVYIIEPEMTTKQTQYRVIASKPIKEIKWNH